MSQQTNRAEHIAWCKQRALEYCDAGDDNQALASMLSDLSKHSETVDHPGIKIGALGALAGMFNGPGEMRRFIEGFH